MFWEQSIQYAVLSDVGFRRQNNQDSCAIQLSADREQWQERGHLFLVADGMGGHAVGELASKIAADTVPHTFDKLREQPPTVALKSAIETANQAIYERGLLNRDFLRMGTTCTALVLCPLGAIIGHVGDSRIYRIRRQQIDQLTRDHSLVWELIAARKVHPRDADTLYPRNVITRSLGPEPEVQVDLEGPTTVLPGDVFVLCSDGLSTLVSDHEIGMIARELPPAEACRLLVNLANLRGGSDNVTVIVVRAGEVPEGAETAELPTYDADNPWATFVLVCWLILASLVGLGLVLLTVHQIVGGVILAAVALIAILAALMRRQRRSIEPPLDVDHSTIIWRPYRTASARIVPEFLHRLAKLESELHRAAVDEQWPINLREREAVFQRAQEALKSKRYSEALSDYAKSLDLLMAGVLWQRKQQRTTSRWGKPAEGRRDPVTPPTSDTGAS